MKLIALDLDGTTFNSKKDISEENRKAIQMAQQQGHIVMVLSGRAPNEIFPSLEKYGLHCHVGANNGASLYIDGQLVNLVKLQPEQCYKIAKELDKEYIPYTISTQKGVFAPLDWEQRLESMFSSSTRKHDVDDGFDLELIKNFPLEYGHKHFKQIEDLIKDETNTIQKFFGITLDVHQKERIETFLHKLDDISIASTSLYFDIMHRHASKGNALSYMATYFEIPLEDTVAIGDESNDISMFQTAGLAVAMGNASDEVKKHSDVITLTNDENGVAFALNKYVLGN
ncbi:HAD family phosphatase [Ornithinibacillus massiliensis]|nr:HAD family phosphatase [Ornithinibacillus massiliensis]